MMNHVDVQPIYDITINETKSPSYQLAKFKDYRAVTTRMVKALPQTKLS